MHNNAPSPRLRRLPRISLRSLAAATLISSAIALTAPVASAADNVERHPQGDPCVVDAVDDGGLFTEFETQLDVGPTGVLLNDTTCDLTPAYGAASSGAFAGNIDGSFTFVPAAGFTGNVTVPYSLVSIDQIPIDSATITIFVAPPPCDVALADDAYSTPFNTPLVVPAPAVGGNDTACGDPFQLVSPTTNGTLVFNADGSFSYTPNAGFIGVDQFVYTLDVVPVPAFRRNVFAGFRAPSGVAPDTAVVTITIEGPPATTTVPGPTTTTATTVPAPTTTTVVTSDTLPATR